MQQTNGRQTLEEKIRQIFDVPGRDKWTLEHWDYFCWGRLEMVSEMVVANKDSNKRTLLYNCDLMAQVLEENKRIKAEALLRLGLSP